MFKIFFWTNIVFAIMNVGLGFYWLAGFNAAVALLMYSEAYDDS